MSTMSTAGQALPRTRARAVTRLPPWWPLGALVVLAAALRLSTLGLQSFWFDEAFTPVHVLHPSLFKTLDSITKTENSPPLWYIVEWVDYRLLGTSEWALRLPSALAGIALVPVAWGIGRELAGRAAAIATAAIVTVSPIFVWYSQEARVYGLYALASAVLILCFLRLLARPDRGRLIAFAAAGVLALLTHYFTAFLLIGMGVWLLARPETRRAAIAPLVAIGVVGLALLPLISAQGGRNTSWIGNWPLKQRLEAIPQYFLTGYNSGSLGHGVELLVALPLLAACALGVWRMIGAPANEPAEARTAGASARGEAGAPSEPAEQRHRRAAALMLWLAACGFLIPLVLAVGGADYLAPRNVLGAMVPVAALIAVLGTWPRAGVAGAALLALGVLALGAITIDINLSPRLQRGDWRGLAEKIPAGSPERVVTSPLFGSAPLEHYLPGLQSLPAHATVSVREIVETGEEPLPETAAKPPAGFRLAETQEVNGLIAFRFTSPAPQRLTEEQLRKDVLDRGERWVLVPGNARTSR
jgi:4-amino-4-deoxy-L-arabinose transferase-like glycosyltransferase